MKVLELHLEMLGFWHCGTGLSSGNAIDLSCQRDALGLPVIPGRTLKGLLRDAMPATQADALFGRGQDGERTLAGVLRVSDARLPQADRDALPADASERLRLVAPLFRTIYQTAIDSKTHTASDLALRAIEVSVPLHLVAEVMPIPGVAPPNDWEAHVTTAAASIHAIGKQRARGLGRVRITAGGRR